AGDGSPLVAERALLSQPADAHAGVNSGKDGFYHGQPAHHARPFLQNHRRRQRLRRHRRFSGDIPAADVLRERQPNDGLTIGTHRKGSHDVGAPAESQRSSRVRVPLMGPTNRYSSPGRPTLRTLARCPMGTSVSVANSAENAFLKLLVLSRSS